MEKTGSLWLVCAKEVGANKSKKQFIKKSGPQLASHSSGPCHVTSIVSTSRAELQAPGLIFMFRTQALDISSFSSFKPFKLFKLLGFSEYNHHVSK